MNIEKWMKWEPIIGIPQTLFLQSLNYDCNNLIINLYNPRKEFEIITIDFDGFLAFRIMDESKYSWEIREVDQALRNIQQEPDSLQKWSLFTIGNSNYADWFLQQSGGIHDDDPIVHYIMGTPDDIVEVLDIETANSPIVKWN